MHIYCHTISFEDASVAEIKIQFALVCLTTVLTVNCFQIFASSLYEKDLKKRVKTSYMNHQLTNNMKAREQKKSFDRNNLNYVKLAALL